MRAVVQRVLRASVVVEGREVGAIGRGLLVYLGVARGDTDEERAWMLAKLLGLRIFADEANTKMDRSVLDVGGSLLVVSQFTLFGDVRKGNRPSFAGAMAPDAARDAYDAFVRDARERVPVATGIFAADMRVESVNDGPVTIVLERPPGASTGDPS
jgi:D-aminoacyl-tRNA deacylase